MSNTAYAAESRRAWRGGFCPNRSSFFLSFFFLSLIEPDVHDDLLSTPWPSNRTSGYVVAAAQESRRVYRIANFEDAKIIQFFFPPYSVLSPTRFRFPPVRARCDNTNLGRVSRPSVSYTSRYPPRNSEMPRISSGHVLRGRSLQFHFYTLTCAHNDFHYFCRVIKI